MAEMLIRGGKVITLDKERNIFDHGAVAVSGNKIKEVGFYADLKAKYPDAKEIGGENMWVIPGFVNAHYHSQALFQVRNGLLEGPLETWLLRAYSSKIGSKTPELPYWETAYACLTLLKAGITSTIDLYYGGDDPHYLNSLDGLKAYIDAGIRVNFAPVARDEKTSYVYAWDDDFVRSLPEKLQKELKSRPYGKQPIESKIYTEGWENLYRDFNGHDDRIRLMFAPDGAQWVTQGFLMTIKKMAKKYRTNIQTHCLETKYQLFYGQNHFGKSLVEYLYDLGFLGEEVSFGHGVWLTAKDIELCAATGTSISHNPGANLRLYSGIAPLRDYLEGGINMGIGTDNLSFDNENGFLNELRLAFLLHRAPGIPPVSVSSEKLFEMATIGGAKLLGLDDKVGSLTPSKEADIVLVDTKRLLSPFMHPSISAYEVLLHRGTNQDIHTVMVRGNILLEGGKVKTLDEEEVLAQYRNYGEKAWTDEDGDHTILDELDKYATVFYQKEAFDILTNYQFNTK